MEESDGGLWFFLLSKCVQTHELVSSAMTEDICKEGTTGDLLETLFHYIHILRLSIWMDSAVWVI